MEAGFENNLPSKQSPLETAVGWQHMAANLSAEAQKVLEKADEVAQRYTGGSRTGARHVAYVLFCDHAVGPRVAWATGWTDVRALQSDLDRLVLTAAPAIEASQATDEVGDLLRIAQEHQSGSGLIEIGDIIMALFDSSLNLAPVMAQSGLTVEGVRAHLPKALRAMKIYAEQVPLGERGSPPADWSARDRNAVRSKMTKAMRKLQPERQQPRKSEASPSQSTSSTSKSSAEPSKADETLTEMAEMAPKSAKRASSAADSPLAKYGINLVDRAREGLLDPVIGREAEIERVLQILSRRTKNNACLVGAPGVGKTAVAEAVAQRIARGDVPTQLSECTELWSLDIGALLAGTSLRGDFEERLLDVLKQIREARGQILLFIDELHLVLGAGRSESNNVDAANLMKPMLARGELRCIGATTTDEYRKFILSKDAAFERRFQVVELQEPTLAVAETMLSGLAPMYASHHSVEIPMDTIRAAVSLSYHGIPGRYLPDKAIDVLDEACCVATSQGAAAVSVAHIQAVVQRWTNSSGVRSKWPWLRQTSSWLQRRSRL